MVPVQEICQFYFSHFSRKHEHKVSKWTFHQCLSFSLLCFYSGWLSPFSYPLCTLLLASSRRFQELRPSKKNFNPASYATCWQFRSDRNRCQKSKFQIKKNKNILSRNTSAELKHEIWIGGSHWVLRKWERRKLWNIGQWLKIQFLVSEKNFTFKLFWNGVLYKVTIF